jgi:hypothetical protein
MVREERPDGSENRPPGEVDLGTIGAPGLAGDVTTRVPEELAEDLGRSYGAVGWRTVLEVDRLVEPPALTTDLIDAARRKLLERGWDHAVVVTDLPLKRNGRPVALHFSPAHGRRDG